MNIHCARVKSTFNHESTDQDGFTYLQLSLNPLLLIQSTPLLLRQGFLLSIGVILLSSLVFLVTFPTSFTFLTLTDRHMHIHTHTKTTSFSRSDRFILGPRLSPCPRAFVWSRSRGVLTLCMSRTLIPQYTVIVKTNITRVETRGNGRDRHNLSNFLTCGTPSSLRTNDFRALCEILHGEKQQKVGKSGCERDRLCLAYCTEVNESHD